MKVFCPIAYVNGGFRRNSRVEQALLGFAELEGIFGIGYPLGLGQPSDHRKGDGRHQTAHQHAPGKGVLPQKLLDQLQRHGVGEGGHRLDFFQFLQRLLAVFAPFQMFLHQRAAVLAGEVLGVKGQQVLDYRTGCFHSVSSFCSFLRAR